MAVKILFLACVGLMLVNGQDDGRYRPSGDNGRYQGSNDGKYSDTDGKYVQQNNKYVQTNDRISGFGSSRIGAGGVVNIDGSRKATKATTTTTAATVKTTEISELPPPQPSSPPQTPPPPPFFLIDTGSNAVSINQDDSSAAEPNIKILRQEQEGTADGYRFVYETENGIVAEESGQIEKTESGDDALRTTGFYQYIGDDGKQYRVDYVADVNGFSAKGDHLPTPPPVPAEIQELLNTLATKQPDSA